MASPVLSIKKHFAKLKDPRINRRRRHTLMDIIVIAICGVICGCKSWDEIAIYGRSKADWLHTFLELPNPPLPPAGEKKKTPPTKSLEKNSRNWPFACQVGVCLLQP